MDRRNNNYIKLKWSFMVLQLWERRAVALQLSKTKMIPCDAVMKSQKCQLWNPEHTLLFWKLDAFITGSIKSTKTDKMSEQVY